ncbi:MAG: hypothetical protein ACXWUG_27630 [Polyangiales bacterium]
MTGRFFTVESGCTSTFTWRTWNSSVQRYRSSTSLSVASARRSFFSRSASTSCSVSPYALGGGSSKKKSHRRRSNPVRRPSWCTTK